MEGCAERNWEELRPNNGSGNSSELFKHDSKLYCAWMEKEGGAGRGRGEVRLGWLVLVLLGAGWVVSI